MYRNIQRYGIYFSSASDQIGRGSRQGTPKVQTCLHSTLISSVFRNALKDLNSPQKGNRIYSDISETEKLMAGAIKTFGVVSKVPGKLARGEKNPGCRNCYAMIG